MTTAPYELVPEPGGVLARINVRGSAVLASPCNQPWDGVLP